MVTSYTLSTESSDQSDSQNSAQMQNQPNQPTPAQQEPAESGAPQTTTTPPLQPPPRRRPPLTRAGQLVRSASGEIVELGVPTRPSTPVLPPQQAPRQRLNRVPSIRVPLRGLAAIPAVDTTNARAVITSPDQSPVEAISPLLLPSPALTGVRRQSTDNTTHHNGGDRPHDDPLRSHPPDESPAPTATPEPEPEQQDQPEPESEAVLPGPEADPLETDPGSNPELNPEPEPASPQDTETGTERDQHPESSPDPETQSISSVAPEVGSDADFDSDSSTVSFSDAVADTGPQRPPQQRLNLARVNLVASLAARLNTGFAYRTQSIWTNAYRTVVALNRRTRADGGLHADAGDVYSRIEDRDNSRQMRWRYAWVTGDPEDREFQRQTVGRRGGRRDTDEPTYKMVLRWMRDIDQQMQAASEQGDPEEVSDAESDEDSNDESEDSDDNSDDESPDGASHDAPAPASTSEDAGQDHDVEERQQHTHNPEGGPDQTSHDEAVTEQDSLAQSTAPILDSFPNPPAVEAGEEPEDDQDTDSDPPSFRRALVVPTASEQPAHLESARDVHNAGNGERTFERPSTRRSPNVLNATTTSNGEGARRTRQRVSVADYWRRKAERRSMLSRQVQDENDKEEAKERKRSQQASCDYHEMLTTK